MKYTWILFAIAALVLPACGPAQEPTMSPAEVQGTAMAAAMTMVAETQAAIPTATLVPPTEMPTSTPFPTTTFPPLNLTPGTQSGQAVDLTQQALQAAGVTQPATQAFAIAPTPTSPPSVGANDPCNAPLLAWDGPSAKLTIVNNTRPKGHVIIALGFTTTWGQCGIISANVDSSAALNVPVGSFWASAFVDGKTDFKVFGGDVLTRTANYTLWVENDRIILKAGCAPNC